jgi:hypothetical protein
MSIKNEAYEILEELKNPTFIKPATIKVAGDYKSLIEVRALFLMALIKNGSVHADDVWDAEQVILAWNEVKGHE